MSEGKPVVFTAHAVQRMKERGASENSVLEAIRIGERESAQKGCSLCRLNLEFKRGGMVDITEFSRLRRS